MRAANVVIAAASALSLFYAAVGSARFVQTRAFVMLIVVALLVCLAAGLLLTLRANVERRIGIALAIITTGICLGILEVVSTMQMQALGGTRGRATRPIVLALRASGIRAQPNILPRHFFRSSTFLPLSAAAHRRTVFCNQFGKLVVYDTDEHGFNNPVGLWSGNADVLLTGDSFMQGICVEREHTIAGQLRDTWPRTLNLGMANNGPLLELATLLEYGSAVRPRAVVWAFFEGNDMRDLESEREHQILRRYLERGFSQRLLERQAAVDSVADVTVIPELAARQKSPWKRTVSRFMRLANTREQFGLMYKAPPDLELFSAVLRQADNHTRQWGGRLYFLYLPEWTRTLERVGQSNELRDSVLARVRESRIPIIDPYGTFQSRGPSSLFEGNRRYPGHYNEAGYAVVADAIADTLRRVLN